MIKWFMKETDTPKYKVTFSLAIQCFYHTICRPNSVQIFTVLHRQQKRSVIKLQNMRFNCSLFNLIGNFTSQLH